ncbi:ST2B1-like protein [Mya arenaria]|uniref:ST2B1-like protein n=1 Tax=Mya arenaria TaxID=6604 RepID=A0ABY7FAN0_MYAAR|nr:ST2B1-like protein [Mya arenaria]
MTTVTEVDAGGASMTITLVDGDYHMPPFDPNPKDTEKRVKAVPEFKCRPDDVTGMLEFPSDKEAEPSPRILNSHLKPKYLPKAVFQEKRKAVLVLRNPKDVVVSYFFHAKGNAILNYEGTFENFLKMSMEGRVEYNGKIGDWNNTFTDAQKKMYEAFLAEKLDDCTLKFRYEYKK